MAHKYQVRVNDREVEVELIKREGALVQFLANGERYEVEVQPKAESFQANIAAPTVAAPAARPSTIKPKAGSVSSAAIVAPMPGIIVSISVKEGEKVSAGQTVCVMEAMKMENNIPAPRAGTVRKVLAQTGKEVEGGQVLMEVDSN